LPEEKKKKSKGGMAQKIKTVSTVNRSKENFSRNE
jgi:hypothetical protein